MANRIWLRSSGVLPNPPQYASVWDSATTMPALYEQPERRLPDSAGNGYVYLFKHGSRREYKIGRTNNAIRREGEIAIELPEAVQPVHVIKTDDPSGVEMYWHRRFAEKRKKGEWFELNAADVAAFKRWKRIV